MGIIKLLGIVYQRNIKERSVCCMKKMVLLSVAALLATNMVSPVLAQEEEGAIRLTPNQLVFGEINEVELIYPEGYSENNQIMDNIKQMVEQSPTIGNEGAVTLGYTGNFIQSETEAQGVFYIVNKLGGELKNVDFTASLYVKGEEIFSELAVEYRAEDFMVMPNNTLLPINLPIPIELVEVLASVETGDDIDFAYRVTDTEGNVLGEQELRGDLGAGAQE